MRRLFQTILLGIFACLPGIPAWAQTVVRGDASELPPIDTTKTFDTGFFPDSNKQFETHALEFKQIEPPPYHGNANLLPMTQWNNEKNDIYPKSLTLKNFEVRQAIHPWDGKTEDVSKPPVDTYESTLSTRRPNLPEAPVPTQNLPSERVVGGEDLKSLINKGILPEEGRVTLGRGFGKLELRDGREVPAPPPSQDEYQRSLKP